MNHHPWLRPLRGQDLEQLVRGEVPTDAPPEVRALGKILDAAAGAGHPDELTGEDEVAAAFRAVHTNAATQQLPVAYPPPAPARPWPLLLKFAAVLVAALIVGFAVVGPARDTLPWSPSHTGQSPEAEQRPSSRQAPPDMTRGAASPHGSGTSTAPSQPTSGPATGPAPSSGAPTAVPATTATQLLDAFRAALAEEAAAGRIQPKRAQELRDLTDKVEQGLASADPNKAAKPLNDLVRKLAEGGADGSIDPAAADRLRWILEPLLPAATMPPGPVLGTTPQPTDGDNGD